MLACVVLFKGNVLVLGSSGGFLAGAGEDIEIAGAAHGHGGGHLAVGHSELAGLDVEHGRAGLHGDVIGAVIEHVGIDGGALFDLLGGGHVALVGDRFVFIGGGLGLGVVAAGGQGGHHQPRQKQGQCFLHSDLLLLVLAR